MTVSLLRFRFALFTLALGPALAGAEPVSLEPVTITGTRTPVTARELPTGTVILEREDIEKMPATNLADVLDTVGGATATRFFGTEGAKTDISLLGAGSINTLILLNGQRFSNVDFGEPDLRSIPLAAIERIEVLPGAGAALYGNGVVGGVINIVTRNRYEDSAGVSMSKGSYDTVAGKGYGSFSRDGINGAAAFDVLNSGGYRDNNELRQRNGFADLRHTSDVGTFFLTATAEDQTLELPGGRMASFTSDDTEFRNNPEGASSLTDQAMEDSWTVSTGAIFPLNETTTLRLDIGRRSKEQITDLSYTYRITEVETLSANPRLVFTGNTGPFRHDLTLGIDRYEYDYDNRSAASESQIGNPSSTKDIEQVQDSVYLHDILHLGEKWAFTAGARHLDVETESRDQSSARSTESHEQGMYEGGVRYHFTESFSGFAGAQRSVRVLNADEIQPQYDVEVRPQTGRTYTTGAEWRKGKQHSTLTLWRARFQDEIIFDSSVDGMPFSFCCNVNSEHPTLRKGASLNSRWKLDDDLFLVINGTYQRGKYESGPNEGNEIPGVPRQTGYLRFDYQSTDWLELSLSHRYVGRRYLIGDDANSASRLPSYRMTDAIARAEWSSGFIEVGGYNLTDELASDTGFKFTDTSYSAYPLPGRHYLATIGLKL